MKKYFSHEAHSNYVTTDISNKANQNCTNWDTAENERDGNFVFVKIEELEIIIFISFFFQD